MTLCVDTLCNVHVDMYVPQTLDYNMLAAYKSRNLNFIHTSRMALTLIVQTFVHNSVITGLIFQISFYDEK